MATFFDGLAQGLAPGLEAWGKRGEMERIAKVLANTYGQPDQPLPPTGQPPHPAAALAALGGQQQPTPPVLKPGVPPPAGQPDPLAPLPSSPAPPQGAPTGQPGAEAPTGMSVNPGLADPTKEAQSLIKNLWQTTKARNPKADPLTLMSAVERQIDDIKGVAPITKATMQGQLLYLKDMQLDQYRQARLQQYDHDWLIKYQNAKTAEERVRLNDDRARDRNKIMQEGVDVRQEGVDYQHEDRQASNQTRLTVANIGAASRVSVAQLKEQGLDDRAIAALKGKHGASIASGLSKVLSANPSADPNTAIAALETAYGDQQGAPPKGSGGGGIPANVRQYAKSKGLTVVAKQGDGWVVRDKAGKTYHLSGG